MIDYANIDDKIVGIVRKLNEFPDVQTVYSCQGHILSASSPYIAFISPTSFAAKFEHVLRTYRKISSFRLYTPWTITGVFNDCFQLVFRLHPPAYNGCNIFLQRAIINHDWFILEELLPYIGRNMTSDIFNYQAER